MLIKSYSNHKTKQNKNVSVLCWGNNFRKLVYSVLIPKIFRRMLRKIFANTIIIYRNNIGIPIINLYGVLI